MKTRRLVSSLLALSLLLGAGAAHARQQAGRSFEGKGWNQSVTTDSLALPAAFAGTSRGAFCFDLQRTGSIPFARPEAVFELVDDQGGRLLALKVSWAMEADQGPATLYFQGVDGEGADRQPAAGLWGPVVEIDRAVAVGQKIRVDLTWDDDTRTYEVFVDGRAQTLAHGGFDPARKEWYPASRGYAGRESGNKALAKAATPRPLGALLARAAAVRLGSYEVPGRTPKRPRSLLLHALLDNFEVFVDEIPRPGGTGARPAITSVAHDAARVAGFSGKLVGGDALHVTIEGTAGAAGTFDVVHYPDLGRRIDLDWRGWGVSLDEEDSAKEGEVDLAEVTGYRVYASREPFDPAAPAIEPVAQLPVAQQSYALESLEIDQPYYVAVIATMRDGSAAQVLAPLWNLPLAETAPGVYAGTHTVGWRDRYPRARVVGRLASRSATAALEAGETLAIDPSLAVAVAATPAVLKADETSKAKVTVTVTNANGNPVSGHRVALLLATTSQYTGVVGGGAFAEQVGGGIEQGFFAETDLFGKVSATYVAGFAAKTAIIVARDLTGGSTGAAAVRTFIQSAAELELLPVEPSAAADAGYAIAVSASDEWLTADGKSQARITAKVTLNGGPVEGHDVKFNVSAGSGSVRVVKGRTGSDGEARAVYTAGTKIGLALITATDATVGISGSLQIELRSDAPAKIALKFDPEQLPADGRSTATLAVLVTDVNDNPSENTEVEYRVGSGGGRLKDDAGLTDKRGESSTEYVAGRTPGRVSIEVTVRSAVPTEREFEKARDLALAVPDARFF